MQPEFYRVRDVDAGFLAVMPRPRAGDWLADEIAGLRSLGISVVASLLEPSESSELGLLNEGDVCGQNSIEFISFPIPDRGTPAHPAGVLDLIRILRARLRTGDGVAVHCRAGIGRTGMIAAALLVSLGVEPDDAFTEISRARGIPVPDTQTQIEWIYENAERIRNGT